MTPEYKVVLGIFRNARIIEDLAKSLYTEFSRIAVDSELSKFWLDLSQDESAHLDFWNNLAEMSKTLPINMVIEEPESLLKLLIRNKEIASKMLEDIKTADNNTYSENDFLLMAYRLEFYMLDYSFQNLFQSLRFLQSDFDPVREYDEHIGRFIQGLLRFGDGHTETILLAETLDRLWKENKRLNRVALEDTLTGALNRRGFMIMGSQICSLIRRKGTSAGLIMLDLDSFKQLNDNHGHIVGDNALIQTVHFLKNNLRKYDIVGRYGGDEFVVLLPDTDNTEQVKRKIVNKLNVYLDENFGISATAGYYQNTVDCENVTECLENMIMEADTLLCSLKSRR